MLKKADIERLKTKILKGQALTFIQSNERGVKYKDLMRLRQELIDEGKLKKKRPGFAWRNNMTFKNYGKSRS